MVKRSQKTNKKTNVHDNFFKKEIESNRDFSLCIFRKVFDPPTFRLFDWGTLKSEATAYIDHKSRPKMADFVFSVNVKGSGKKTDIMLLLEHKTGKGGDLLQQLLEYQTAIYSTRKNPIVPVLVYQGPEKKWQGPLNFQDSLVGMIPTVRKRLGGVILNFNCRFLNLREIGTWEKRDLTVNPILYIMANIWKMDVKGKLFDEFSKHCRKVKEGKTQKILLDKGLAYLHRFDEKKFSWEWLERMEKRNFGTGESVMTMKEIFLKKGLEKGEKKGEKKKQKEIALLMLEKGESVAKICEYTGLTEKQIDALKPGKKAA